MLTINPREMKTAEWHGYMLGAIAPRPIAFVSSIDREGNPNLAPFSFFNCFGSNPPVLIFSPALRGKDGTIKHTLENVREVDEVVVNIVNYAMVHQMSLASTEYPKGVSEFEKAGFTPEPSELVKPPRVKESPVQMECRVMQIIQTGVKGGAGQLVMCEILRMHIKEEVLDAQQKIDPHKIDQVSRLGGDWYSRAAKGLFSVPKPLSRHGIGVDHLPFSIRNSMVLTGNDLGLLGNVESLPTEEEIAAYLERSEVKKLLATLKEDPSNSQHAIHLAAHHLLENGAVEEAWKLLIAATEK